MRRVSEVLGSARLARLVSAAEAEIWRVGRIFPTFGQLSRMLRQSIFSPSLPPQPSPAESSRVQCSSKHNFAPNWFMLEDDLQPQTTTSRTRHLLLFFFFFFLFCDKSYRHNSAPKSKLIGKMHIWNDDDKACWNRSNSTGLNRTELGGSELKIAARLEGKLDSLASSRAH